MGNILKIHVNQIYLKQNLYSLCDSELTSTFESKTHKKIIVTCHRVMENCRIWEGISCMSFCLDSQSVVYQVLSAVQRWCVRAKCLIEK